MDHHELSPSAYPAWRQCAHWERADRPDDTTAEAAAIGTAQHELLHKYMTGELSYDAEVDELSEVLFPVRRAVSGIRQLFRDVFPAGVPDKVLSEVRVTGYDFPMHPFGTADVIAHTSRHLLVVDYKSRSTDKEYWEQLAFYAVAFLDEAFDDHVHLDDFAITLAVWYGDEGTCDTKTTTYDECFALANYAIANRLAKCTPRHASSWCNLCKECGTCPESLRLIALADKALPRADDEDKPIDEATGRIPQLLMVAAELEKRIAAFRDKAKAYAAAHGGIIADRDGTPLFELKPVRLTDLDIQSYYDKVRGILTPADVLAAAKLTKEKAKALLKGRKDKDGNALRAKDIDAIVKNSCTNEQITYRLSRVRKQIEQ